MRTSALAWGPFAVSRHWPPLSLMWVRFARLRIHFHPPRGPVVRGYVLDAMRPASSGLLMRLITELVNLLLQGDVPESVRPFVCGASVMALRKPDGTLRPIAVGETIRRITSKVAVELISDRARTILEPLQLGVKTSNGCEAIIHTTRQWFHQNRSDPPKTAISVDISNAFNTVHRSAVVQSVRTHFPSLAPWVDCCYRHDSHLFTGSSAACDQVIPSSRGAQQGDPLGPALFALAIHSTIQEARQDTERSFPSGLDICAFYLDDGICAGFAPAVSFFLSSLALGLGRIGLVVNLSKTEVLPACTTSQSFGPDSFPGCNWNGSASFKLLGAATGPPDCCELLLGRRVAKARALIDAVGRFPDAQGAFCWMGKSPAALRTSGFPGEPPASPRLGTSRSRPSFAPLFSPPRPPPWLVSSMKSNPARIPS